MPEMLPQSAVEFMDWDWPRIAPTYAELQQRPLTARSVAGWLADWSRVGKLIQERYARLNVARSANTEDHAADQAYHDFLTHIFPPVKAAEQSLRLRLLKSGLEPAGMQEPLLKMQAEVATFADANLPLETEESRLKSRYDRTVGTQSVFWDGEARTLSQLQPFLHHPDRALREAVWRQKAERQLSDREAINGLWRELLANRLQQAANAGYPDYRAFRWQQLKRFAYSPADCRTFQHAIAEVAVPAANRVYEKLRRRLGVDRLRPWDVDADVYAISHPPLHPFSDVSTLSATAATMFHRLDERLGVQFDVMRAEGLLDLPNRPGKAPGAYCTAFPMAGRPFIFANAVGASSDVNTLLHEAGHAFHVFAAVELPYLPQMRANMEFNEVASMAMELLAAPYLPATEGGFYSAADAARHRLDHLYRKLLFWPYMAVVDGFQHWVYQHPEAAADPDQCDARWDALWQAYLPAVDWNGVEDVRRTGWHRKQHIHRSPFYYVEYGMAQLGAIQVWRNAGQDRAAAVGQYLQALALGGTVSLPALYAAAGARFAFDLPAMREAVALLEKTMAELELEAG